MLHFYGNLAFSEFRREQLLVRLKEILPQLIDIKAYYIYWVQHASFVSKSDQAKLTNLLAASDVLPFETTLADGVSQLTCCISPRIGTISPWSTKATDIVHHCELRDVSRVERGIYYQLIYKQDSVSQDLPTSDLFAALHDPLLESVLAQPEDAIALFNHMIPEPMKTVDILGGGIEALSQANVEQGFALNNEEMDYLVTNFNVLGRNPADVELMMFAQINSEHCRHKIFKADWKIDNQMQPNSLFGMIQQTYAHHKTGVLSAYSDNAAVLEGQTGKRFYADPHTHVYTHQEEPIHYVLKVETHNHPTAISPFPGVATGAGGEIRDEGATGRGGKPKAGLTGFTVSHLHIPALNQPWELNACHAKQLASSLEIMLEGPIGGAAFNNEFGRPNICGYFRTFELPTPWQASDKNTINRLGYHKPIMLTGGIGNISEAHVHKNDLPEETLIIVLGGPAMRIGLGGGAASSLASGVGNTDLDFASVQRGNPEMQRRCQEVIDTCWALGKDNPIISIHDVGAGGLCNAVPEIVHDNARGGKFELRAVLSDEPGMSPLEIWCNESQERYVLAISPEELEQFTHIATRERCPFSVIGTVSAEQQLIVGDAQFDNTPIEMPMDVLFGNPPKMLRDVHHHSFQKTEFNTQVEFKVAAKHVLQFPAVADKSFLITIGDRTVGGLIVRDQFVGPWQVPVSDVAVTAASFDAKFGEAMAIGERTPLAALNSQAASRMAIAEAITNIAPAKIKQLSDLKLSANWMAAANQTGQDAALYDAVKAASELCMTLNLTIPVGKDSMSMRATFEQAHKTCNIVSPVSLIVTAAASVFDVNDVLTPELKPDVNSSLLFIDIGKGQQRMGGSVLAQTYQQLGHHTPDCDDPMLLANAFALIQTLHAENKVLAYHDKSDGGLFATLCEMMFASHLGLECDITPFGEDAIATLFNEELGMVIQVSNDDLPAVHQQAKALGMDKHLHTIATLSDNDSVRIYNQNHLIYEQTRTQLHTWWSETSYRLQALRDNPACAESEYEQCKTDTRLKLSAALTFDPQVNPVSAYVSKNHKPKVAILREQGVNGQLEMAAAFTQAGFEAVDVHMSDVLGGRIDLNHYVGLAACGGFSYGDVLGAGQGWAKSILHHPQTRDKFQDFFNRQDSFTLGVCNGCQMLAHLSEIIPGADHWPLFLRNTSEQFEARLAMVKVQDTSSMLFEGMVGSVMSVVVSHAEGCADWETSAERVTLQKQQQVTMAFVDNENQATEIYPMNPNGSPKGVTGICNVDGRINLMMPHPERIFQTRQFSWHPSEWGSNSPWLRLFENARCWVD